MKVWAFDVDETLEISNGPVKLTDLVQLRNEGHVVGICGNWGLFCSLIQNWHTLISFISLGLPKEAWLRHFREILPWYEDYIMVGNRLGRINSKGASCGSADEEAAKLAGWRFLLEDEFAAGAR